MKDERKEEVYLDTSTSQILEMGDSFKYKPTKETNMKCPKCNTEMDYITTECIEIGDEECKGYWECPVCVKKLVLKDVIGGLEKKKYGLDFGVFKGEKEGHNQLCNREVEYDKKSLRKELDKPIVFSKHSKGYIMMRDKDLIIEIVGKAIEQGKVLKVKE